MDQSAYHLERWVGQHGFAKSFDKFAPIRPAIALVAFVKDSLKLELSTWVNGQLRRNTVLIDLRVGMREILQQLSRRTTIRAGIVIMTGIPMYIRKY